MNVYTGFHAVEERVRFYSSEKSSIVKLKIYYSKPGPRIKKIIQQAKDAGIECIQASDSELEERVKNLPKFSQDHRGIVLVAEGEKQRSLNSVELDQWILSCPEKATAVILDNVTDPHNVGAVLRSCDQFGASVLIVPSYHGVGDVQNNEVVARTSAGASAYVPVATVTNLVRSVQMLKDAGFWIYGADAGGSPLQNVEFPEKTCFVMGSEGSGISRLLQAQCDAIVSIPTCGKIDSLNVSVAAGILLYERHRQEI